MGLQYTTSNNEYTLGTPQQQQQQQAKPHSHESDQRFPPIDELLNDCFLQSINELDDHNKAEVVKNFKTYVKSLHCIENLNFLISIYNYEFIFNNVFHEKPVLNSRKNSIHSMTTLNSFKSTENFPINYFASTIDDISTDTIEPNPFGTATQNYWDNLRDKQLELDLESDSDVASRESAFSRPSSSPNSDDGNCNLKDPQVLVNYLHFIMDSFIVPESKYQINLSNAVSRCLIEQINSHEANKHLPNPSIFLKAKMEILQLLNDNVYYSFIKKSKACEKLPCDSCTCELREAKEDVTTLSSEDSGVEDYKIDPIVPTSSNSVSSSLPSCSIASNMSSSIPSGKKFFGGPLKFTKSQRSRASSPVSINSMNSAVGQSPVLSPSPSNSHTPIGSPIFKKSSNLNSISSILTHLKLNKGSHSQTSSSLESGDQTPVHSNSNSNVSSFNHSHRNSFETSPLDDDKKFRLWKSKK